MTSVRTHRAVCAALWPQVCEDAVRSAVNSEAADEALELDCDHATPTIKELVCGVAPTPPYVKYHDTYLRRCGGSSRLPACGVLPGSPAVVPAAVCSALVV